MQYYNPHFLICTFFGLGKISKKFPGTIGSLAAIPISYFIDKFARTMLAYTPIDYYDYAIAHFLTPLFILLLLFILGSYSANKYEIISNTKDAKEVVIDEIVGQSLCILVTFPMTLTILVNNNFFNKEVIYYDVLFLTIIIANVVLFRIFDIFKPWPIKYFEQKIPGGLGIMFDDLLAAIFTIVIYFALFLTIIDFL